MQQESGQKEFKSQEEVDAYLEKVYKMQPTIDAIRQAFPKQGKANSPFWVIARYFLPRWKRSIQGAKKE